MKEPAPIDAILSRKLSNMSLFCAFLVVMLHCVFGAEIKPSSGIWCFYTLFQEQFIRIAVPFFFAAAGFLLVGHTDKGAWWKTSVKSRIKTLLIPYCCFVMLHFCLLNVGKSWHQIDYSFLAWLERFGLLLRQPHPGILWFVRTLFLFVLISPLLVTILSNKCLGICTIIVMQGLHVILYRFWPNNENWKIFWDYLFFYRGLCFFAAGIFLRFNPKIWKSISHTSFIYVGAFCLSMIRIGLIFRSDSYHLYPIIVCFELPLWVISIWLLMTSRPLPKWLTSCAFPVYLLHPYIWVGLQNFLTRIFHAGVWNEYLVIYFCLAVCTFSISCAVSIILRKLSPVGARWLFGGR